MRRLWLAFVRGKHHVVLPLWLVTFVPGMAAVVAHGYDRDNWLHWAHVVFYAAAPLAFAIAWLGDRTTRVLR
jgi:hypothetical protein